MDQTSILTEPTASKGSMQTVKQYLSNQGKIFCFRELFDYVKSEGVRDAGPKATQKGWL